MNELVEYEVIRADADMKRVVDNAEAREAEQRPSTNPIARDFDARSCHVCGAKPALFGFGPPLVPKQIWSCKEHRL